MLQSYILQSFCLLQKMACHPSNTDGRMGCVSRTTSSYIAVAHYGVLSTHWNGACILLKKLALGPLLHLFRKYWIICIAAFVVPG